MPNLALSVDDDDIVLTKNTDTQEQESILHDPPKPPRLPLSQLGDIEDDESDTDSCTQAGVLFAQVEDRDFRGT